MWFSSDFQNIRRFVFDRMGSLAIGIQEISCHNVAIAAETAHSYRLWNTRMQLANFFIGNFQFVPHLHFQNWLILFFTGR